MAVTGSEEFNTSNYYKMAAGIINTFYEFADYLDLSVTQFYKFYCCNSVRYFFSHSERVVR